MKKCKTQSYLKAYTMLSDLFFSVPITTPCSPILAKMKINPNVITFLSLLTGITSGIMFALGNWVAGALLFHFSYLCDCVDGKVARIRNMTSEFGAKLDVFADGFKKPACFLGIAIYFLSQHLYLGTFLTCVAFVMHVGTHKLFRFFKVSEYDLEFPRFHRNIVRKFTPRLLCLYTFSEEQFLEFAAFPLIGGIIGVPNGAVWFFYGAVLVTFLGLMKLIILINHRKKDRYEQVYQDWAGTNGNLDKM